MNVFVTRAAEGFARRAFTVEEIRRMVEAGIISEDENFELIDGDVVPMSPKGNQHEVIKAGLAERLMVHKPVELRLAIETSLYLDARTFVEPDLCLYPRHILPEDVRGRDVILALEVAGSSMPYEQGLKAGIYARHGVAELWVVDAATRVTWVHRGPGAGGDWAIVEKMPADASLSPVALPDIAVRMADLD